MIFLFIIRRHPNLLRQLFVFFKKFINLFEEYEQLAQKIGVSTNDEEKNHELTCAVVDLRDEPEELKTEVENINGELKIKKTKKKNNQAVREL